MDSVQIASAIEYLHKRAVIHRDVKPSNIFLSSKNIENKSVHARLGDFGVMKWGDFHSSVATGTLTATMQKGLGTMKYMSPEQALQPKNVTVRADVFSFGITLYEMFSGYIHPSFHHVYEVMAARDARGTTESRAYSLGLTVAPKDKSIFEMILEMHRRGPTGRPSIEKVRSSLEWEFEKQTLRTVLTC